MTAKPLKKATKKAAEVWFSVVENEDGEELGRAQYDTWDKAATGAILLAGGFDNEKINQTVAREAMRADGYYNFEKGFWLDTLGGVARGEIVLSVQKGKPTFVPDGKYRKRPRTG